MIEGLKLMVVVLCVIEKVALRKKPAKDKYFLNMLNFKDLQENGYLLSIVSCCFALLLVSSVCMVSTVWWSIA